MRSDNEENHESIIILEVPHPIKDSNTLEKPRVDFIESWFQSIVGEAMQSYSQHTWFIFSPIHIESAPDSLVQAPICFTVLEFIPKSVGCLNGSIGNLPTLESVPFPSSKVG
jgi:hypothetical protein